MRFRFNRLKSTAIKVSASTLLETIVASIIFMIVFTIVMDILTRILISNHKDNEYLIIENSFNKCERNMKQDKLSIGNRTYEFDWGEIQINISQYKDLQALFLVEMRAVTHEKREVNYRYITTDKTGK